MAKRPPTGRPPSRDTGPRAAKTTRGAAKRPQAPARTGSASAPRTEGRPASQKTAKPAKVDGRGTTPRAREEVAAKAAPARRPARVRADGSVAVRKASAQPAVTMTSARDDGLHRIAKLLARAGVASRRDIERMIEDGRVALNGVVVTTPATLLANVDGITVDGNAVAAPTAAQLYLFHKPAGTLTAARDHSGRRTIYDVLPEGLPRLMPVGRLDLNTEGLLLLTTDGELKRKLELPSSGVERTYRARAFGEVTQAQLEDLAEGITIDGMRYGRIDANMERRTGRNVWIEMTLTEGKNREVRRVLEHLGLRVARLIRTRYGPFVLGSSAPGQIEEATAREVEALMRLLK